MYIVMVHVLVTGVWSRHLGHRGVVWSQVEGVDV